MSDWNNEAPPKDTRLLPEGVRGFEIVTGDDKPSKAGNPMFTLQLKDEQTGIVVLVYLIRTPGKRWYLKQVLESVGVTKQDDDNYNYLPEIIGKKIMGEVVHEPNEYINRQGDTITTTQHRINSFSEYTINPDGVKSADEVQWEN
jgi:hypothetical protein